jgi:mono/diheme cytochrome c family protein
MMDKKLLVGALAIAGLATTLACSPGDDAAPAGGSNAAPTAAATKATPEMIARGGEIYKANCAACHGDGGKGDGPGAGVLKPPPRDHTDYEYMSTLTDKEIADVIKMGGAMKGRPLMPSHPQITGTDMDGLVAFIRTLSAPNAPK